MKSASPFAGELSEGFCNRPRSFGYNQVFARDGFAQAVMEAMAASVYLTTML